MKIEADNLPVEPTPLYLNEMLDRVHLMQDMFDNYITNHPMAYLLKDTIEATADALGKLYQEAGNLEAE